jgi:hypothetical protein
VELARPANGQAQRTMKQEVLFFPFYLQKMDALKGFCGLPCCIFFVYGL